MAAQWSEGRFRGSLSGARVCLVSLGRRAKQTRLTKKTRWTRSPPRAAKRWIAKPVEQDSLSWAEYFILQISPTCLHLASDHSLWDKLSSHCNSLEHIG